MSRKAPCIDCGAIHGARAIRCQPCQRVFHLAEPIADRFWAKVDKSGDCWIWTGARNGDGYGNVSVRGGTQKAHRVAFELTFGPIASGMFLCHHCDKPTCVRPDHMFVGTQADNSADAARKGRLAADGIPLTDDQVRWIRREAKTRTKASIARQLGTSWERVDHIVKRETWKHVSEADAAYPEGWVESEVAWGR